MQTGLVKLIYDKVPLNFPHCYKAMTLASHALNFVKHSTTTRQKKELPSKGSFDGKLAVGKPKQRESVFNPWIRVEFPSMSIQPFKCTFPNLGSQFNLFSFCHLYIFFSVKYDCLTLLLENLHRLQVLVLQFAFDSRQSVSFFSTLQDIKVALCCCLLFSYHTCVHPSENTS